MADRTSGGGPRRQLEYLEVTVLTPHPENPRKHSKKQVRQIANSIKSLGFQIPVLVDPQDRLICGHARLEAAKLQGLSHVPAVRVTDLSEAQIRALMIADNRLTEISEWDDRLLGENFKFLAEQELDFDLEITGFEYGHIEQLMGAFELEGDGDADTEADAVPEPDEVEPVCREDDVWTLTPPGATSGNASHRLLCGDATLAQSYQQLLEGMQAAMAFTDAPYNLPAGDIGQVCAASHGDFAMGAGEMSPEEFRNFLASVMALLCRHSEPGSIHYFFMDWRHAVEILTAGMKHYTAFKNLCVWVKDRPGMGTFYRSQHELVFVFKHGDAPHQNNFELGQFGRTRSNVWSYPSVRSLNAEDGDPASSEALAMHPTIKPVKLIAEAIRDCSRRGQIVLDPFLGSGSTLIACENTQRRCFGIELSPRYVDVAIRRWQEWTGGEAVHEATGQTYEALARERQEDARDA